MIGLIAANGNWIAITFSLFALIVSVATFWEYRRDQIAAIPRPKRLRHGSIIRIMIEEWDARIYGISKISRSDGRDVVQMDELSIEKAVHELDGHGPVSRAKVLVYSPAVAAALVRDENFSPGECWEVTVVSLAAPHIANRFHVLP